MELSTFNLSDGREIDNYTEIVNDHFKHIVREWSPSHDNNFFVLYEDSDDIAKRELDRVKSLLSMAEEISTDEQFLTLKNQIQKEIYLLKKYNLIRQDAKIVIELMKVEMADIFKERDENGI